MCVCVGVGGDGSSFMVYANKRQEEYSSSLLSNIEKTCKIVFKLLGSMWKQKSFNLFWEEKSAKKYYLPKMAKYFFSSKEMTK